MTRPEEASETPTKKPKTGHSLRKGLLLGAAVFVLALPAAVSLLHGPVQTPSATAQVAKAKAPVKLAKFNGEPVSADVRQMANWIVYSGDHQKKSFVVVDKKDAKVYVFNPQGELQAGAPALLGEARGDDTAPGVGAKPIAQVLPEEKTTPAGRFIAEVGDSTRGEDVVWVDYDAAVSMHRVLKTEQRLQRLASATIDDNRISFGCINLPPQFYEKVLRPAVDAGGAVIYILPETRALRETFAAFYDVETTVKLAQH